MMNDENNSLPSTVTTLSLDNAIDENTKELRDLPSGILSSQSSNSNESQYSIVNLEGVSDHLFPGVSIILYVFSSVRI